MKAEARIQKSLRITPETALKLEKLAGRMGISQTKIVEIALKEYYEKKGI